LRENQDASTRTLVDLKHSGTGGLAACQGRQGAGGEGPESIPLPLEVSSKASASLPLRKCGRYPRISACESEEEQIAVFVKQWTITGEMAEA